MTKTYKKLKITSVLKDLMPIGPDLEVLIVKYVEAMTSKPFLDTLSSTRANFSMEDANQ